VREEKEGEGLEDKRDSIIKEFKEQQALYIRRKSAFPIRRG
jgi:hypothetical protein